jgi:iron uptake system EfeUOB component EfeO/EfeM
LLVAVVALAVAAIVLTSSSPKHDHDAAGARTSDSAAAAADPYGPPALARYVEKAPHVTSLLNAYAVQGEVQGAPSTPPPESAPVAASAFTTPVAAYRSHSVQQLGLMETEIAKLKDALAANDRVGAESAWRGAFADYLTLGAVYLEGSVATLDQAIDGTSGGLAGGTSSPQFAGLHRLEFGLWTGAPLSSLQPWAGRLATDVEKLRRQLPHVAIDPLDYTTRAHEILEDAVRDLLSGTDVPWSGEGVLGTAAGLAATREVIRTLTPVLFPREGVLPDVNAELAGLQSTLSSLRRAHGGTLPTNSQLTQTESEQLDASIGQALEALAQVPGALETTNAVQPPAIPQRDVKIDP